MNVKKIVAEYLKENGYDGLCNNGCGECGCGIDDLMPCDELLLDCAAAYKHRLPCPECGGGCSVPIGEIVYCENRKDDAPCPEN